MPWRVMSSVVVGAMETPVCVVRCAVGAWLVLVRKGAMLVHRAD